MTATSSRSISPEASDVQALAPFTAAAFSWSPGITIKHRLRVLQPNDPDSYYRARELVPADVLPDIDRAKIVITNYHGFKPRETLQISRTGRALLQGRDPTLSTTLETDGQMLQRVAADLLGFKGVVVLNDEAHHCYQDKSGAEDYVGANGAPRRRKPEGRPPLDQRPRSDIEEARPQ